MLTARRALPLLLVTVCFHFLSVHEVLAKPTTMPTSAPANVIIDLTSPKAMLLSAHRAAIATDFEAFSQCADPTVRPILKAMGDIIHSSKDLFLVMDQKLGKEAGQFKKAAWFIEEDASRFLPSPLAPAVVNGRVDWTKVSIEEQDDKANIVIAAGTIKAKKIKGKWHYVGERGLTSEEVQVRLKEARKLLTGVKVLNQALEKGLNDGSITKDNFNNKALELVMAIAKENTSKAATQETSKDHP